MNNCCINCSNFCWWTNSYCCLKYMKVHQYGYPNGYWMNKDIINTMKTNKNCKGYNYSKYHQELEDEYNKLIEWIKLQDKLDKFVNDYSGIYK